MFDAADQNTSRHELGAWASDANEGKGGEGEGEEQYCDQRMSATAWRHAAHDDNNRLRIYCEEETRVVLVLKWNGSHWYNCISR